MNMLTSSKVKGAPYDQLKLLSILYNDLAWCVSKSYGHLHLISDLKCPFHRNLLIVGMRKITTFFFSLWYNLRSLVTMKSDSGRREWSYINHSHFHLWCNQTIPKAKKYDIHVPKSPELVFFLLFPFSQILTRNLLKLFI